MELADRNFPKLHLAIILKSEHPSPSEKSQVRKETEGPAWAKPPIHVTRLG